MTADTAGADQQSSRLAAVSTPKLAVIAVALLAAAAMAWAYMPAPADGSGSGTMMAAAAAGGTVGMMSATIEGAGAAYAGGVPDGTDGGGGSADDDQRQYMMMTEATARELAYNWLEGALTNDEYFDAMTYMYRAGYLGAGAYGYGDGGAGGLSTSAPHEWANVTVDGPVGADQGWCKPGLYPMEDANTGDMVCVPEAAAGAGGDAYGSGDSTAGLGWVRPLAADGAGEPGVGKGAAAEYRAWPSYSAPEVRAWSGDVVAASNGGIAKSMAGKIDGLNDLNDRLLRTIDALQAEILALRAEGVEGGGTGGDGGTAGVDAIGDRAPAASSGASASSGGAYDGPAKRGGTDRYSGYGASGAAPPGDVVEACLHGTTMQLTSVIDPTTLDESDGSLGSIPMPAGKYTVLVSSGSSTPLSMRLQLAGDAGLSYDQKFILTDTGEPPGEDTTVWDYNSGLVEVVLPAEQTVNATAAVHGGDGLPVFATLAKCR